jgi:predicted RNase H-like HicB family nuclease
VDEIINLQPLGNKTSAELDFKVRVGEVVAMQNRYELVVYWRGEDQYFIVEVPELAGCMVDGSTYQEAVRNAEVVIHEWIETARDSGRPIPEPAGKSRYAMAR